MTHCRKTENTPTEVKCACSVKLSQYKVATRPQTLPTWSLAFAILRFSKSTRKCVQAKMEDGARKREEEIYNEEMDRIKKEEEEERRWREETVRKLAQVLRRKEEEKREKEKSPTVEEIAQDNVIEVLVSRDGYTLIN